VRRLQYYFALSALRKLQRYLPAPMAQAITFRAFGAETLSFQKFQHERVKKTNEKVKESNHDR
jgi:hypothetical protein